MDRAKERREPQEAHLEYCFFRTEWGQGLVIARGDLICRVVMPPGKNEALDELANTPGARKGDRGAALHVAEQIERYFRTGRCRFSAQLEVSQMTDFQVRVLSAAMRIGPGTTRSYAWLAKAAGNPRAARAAAQVMAKNPFPIVVPCHRVVHTNGELGGYSGGGVLWKERLLRMEGVELAHGQGKTAVKE